MSGQTPTEGERTLRDRVPSRFFGTLGAVVTTIGVTWYPLDWPESGSFLIRNVWLAVPAVGVAALFLGWWGGSKSLADLIDGKFDSDDLNDSQKYAKYISFVAYLLLLVGLINTIGLSGLIYNGLWAERSDDHLSECCTPVAKVSPSKDASKSAGEGEGEGAGEGEGEGAGAGACEGAGAGAVEGAGAGAVEGAGAGAGEGAKKKESRCACRARRESTGKLLLGSTMMAILGALFFIANALRKHRSEEHRFDADWFWAGFWFRIGEAVLFTYAFFLYFWFKDTSYYIMMPVLALFLGMFVKSGESLVFGMAQRVLAMAEAAFPPIKAGAARPALETNLPGKVEGLTAKRGKEEGEVQLSWKTPSSGGKVSNFKIYREGEDEYFGCVETVSGQQSSVSLTEQPKGAVSYYVAAVNNIGEGPESEVVKPAR